MNLIEQLGGYEKAKSIRDINIIEFDGDASGVTIHYMGNSITQEDLEKALLEYRRQHNIFKIGDKVVFLSNIAPEHDGIYTIAEVFKNSCFIIEDGMDYGAFYDYIRHASPEEIKAWRRL